VCGGARFAGRPGERPESRIPREHVRREVLMARGRGLSASVALATALLGVLLVVAPVGAISGVRTKDETNIYKKVGGMIGFRPSINAYGPRCTGTLIAPTVFLTASHCTVIFAPGDKAYVSFLPMITPSADPDNQMSWIPATPVVNPNYNNSQG